MEIKIKATSETIEKILDLLKLKLGADALMKCKLEIEEITESKYVYEGGEPIKYDFDKIT